LTGDGGEEDSLTVSQLIDEIRAACADIMHVLPGMSMKELRRLDWAGLCRWRRTAITVLKTTRGITNG
jgi:hypothetical protein